ncbi:MAG: hypothetical protein ABI649_05030 [Gaiellaceae bacterium]
MKRKRWSPEEWAEFDAQNEEVARRLASRIARIQKELDEKRRLAAERRVPRRRLLGFL